MFSTFLKKKKYFSQLQLKMSKNKQNPECFVSCPAVIELIQTDVSQYPFHEQPPAYLRAHRYRYWFTEPKADGSVLSLSPSEI